MLCFVLNISEKRMHFNDFIQHVGLKFETPKVEDTSPSIRSDARCILSCHFNVKQNHHSPSFDIIIGMLKEC